MLFFGELKKREDDPYQMRDSWLGNILTVKFCQTFSEQAPLTCQQFSSLTIDKILIVRLDFFPFFQTASVAGCSRKAAK